MIHVELRDGMWAEMRERITHGVDKEIKKAVRRGRDDPDAGFEADTVLVRAFVREWSVRDPDGNPISIGDADAIDRAPDDIIEDLARAAASAWTGATIPNPRTPPSSEDSS